MSSIIYQACRLGLAILYPAYSSFKAVRSKNVKEYVKWMMYWIVFALFSFVEAFADFFLAWFPFYFELKICFVLWLVSPATRGASVLYRKVVHPQLLKREKEIDANISKATDQGYSTLITLGSRGFTLATNIVLSTAIKGSTKLSDQLQKSLSLNDLSGDGVDYRPPRRRLEAKFSLDEEEMENRILSERYRMEMAGIESMEGLDRIDQGVEKQPVLEVQDVQRIQRRRKIESTLRQVMSDDSSPLTQSLVGSMTLPRKFKPKDIMVAQPITEVLNEPPSDFPSPTGSASPSLSAGTASISTIPSFFVPDPGAPSVSTESGPNPTLIPPEPKVTKVPESNPVILTSSGNYQSSGNSGASALQRLRMNFFSSHSHSKPK